MSDVRIFCLFISLLGKTFSLSYVSLLSFVHFFSLSQSFFFSFFFSLIFFLLFLTLYLSIFPFVLSSISPNVHIYENYDFVIICLILVSCSIFSLHLYICFSIFDEVWEIWRQYSEIVDIIS